MTIRLQEFAEHGYMPWDFGNLSIATLGPFGMPPAGWGFIIYRRVCYFDNFSYAMLSVDSVDLASEPRKNAMRHMLKQAHELGFGRRE